MVCQSIEKCPTYPMKTSGVEVNDTDEMDEMKEVIDEFLVESSENLDQLDNDLLVLEEDPSNAEVMGSIFRTIHTIKGTCGFLGFNKLEKVSHVGENLLSRLRDGALTLTEERTSALLKMVDAIRQMLTSIEKAGNDGEETFPELIERLTALLEDQPDAAQQKPEQEKTEAPIEPTPVNRPLGEKLVQDGSATPKQVAKGLQKQLEGDTRPLGEILVNEVHGVGQEKIKSTVRDQHIEKAHTHSIASSNIRVDVGLLDQLMNLVGELVLTRNQILQYSGNVDNPNLINASQHLSLITTELQERVMQTRMQPIGSVWSKFPRVVRDLAHRCGKEIQIVMEGKETELDKTLIEAIKDPLIHLVRNSVDHGIEMPDVRTAKGKPAEGTLLLRAFHESGLVNIEIIDDGGGIDPELLKTKAVEKELITAEQAGKMSDKEAWNLIFKAGLSTAKKVTNISGRGVGMDVVKTNIEKIGGVIEIHSKPGEGTTIRIKIPLTLAIIPALTVISAGDRYAIPQVNLLELVCLEGEDVQQAIEMVHGVPVYRLRGHLLPLIYLNHELWGDEAPTSNGAECVNIVVLQTGEQHFGLVVDDIDDTQEIVVKPLGKQLSDIASFAGATIMGDGNVAMILDVFGLADRAHLISELSRNKAMPGQSEENSATAKNQRMLVLIRNPDGGRMAVPMTEVTRLEELPKSTIEIAGNQDVVRYRDEIMPLIGVTSTLPERRTRARLEKTAAASLDNDAEENLQVIVCSDNDKPVGLIVHRITDVIEDSIAIEGKSSRQGVLGTGVIQDHVTEFLDVNEVIRMAGANH